MSRARPIRHGSTELWINRSEDSKPAKLELLELWADLSNESLDDLLDAEISQAKIVELIRTELHGNLIPEEVLIRRREAKKLAKLQPQCRICSLLGEECEGRLTKHHFVPRWLMKELDNYNSYAARSRCTILICLGSHARLHQRKDNKDKSIVPYLTTWEKQFAQKMLEELKDQHPIIFDLISAGSGTYESQLAEDFIKGKFKELDSGYESAIVDLAARM